MLKASYEKNGILLIFKSSNKKQGWEYIHSVKEKQDKLLAKGVYRILCKCGKFSLVRTDRPVSPI